MSALEYFPIRTAVLTKKYCKFPLSDSFTSYPRCAGTAVPMMPTPSISIFAHFIGSVTLAKPKIKILYSARMGILTSIAEVVTLFVGIELQSGESNLGEHLADVSHLLG